MALRGCSRPLIGALLVLALGGVGRAAHLAPLPAQPPGVPFPTETWPEAPPGPDVDPGRLAAALNRAFVAKGSDGVPDTRALLVIHRRRRPRSGSMPQRFAARDAPGALRDA